MDMEVEIIIEGPMELEVEIIEAIKDGDGNKVEEWYREHIASDANFDLNQVKDTRDGKDQMLKSVITRHQMTALNYAAFYGRLSTVEFLLSMGADPTIKNVDDENALHCAVQCERIKDGEIVLIVGRLLEKRNDYIDAVNSEGQTALFSAITVDNIETVKLLLKNGADPTLNPMPEKVMHPLAAAACNDGKILKELLEIRVMREPKELNKKVGEYSYTALHFAVLYLRKECVKLLTEAGASITIAAADDHKSCPIHYCLEAKNEEDFTVIVTHLKASINVQNSLGYTLLHLLVMVNKIGFVKILRSEMFQADYDVTDNEGRYPLHYLCRHMNNETLVDLLADRYVIRAKDKKGITPFQLAVKGNDVNLVRVLLRAEARSIQPDEDKSPGRGRSAVHLATLVKGTDEDFKKMIMVFMTNMDAKSFKILLDAVDDDGKTSLHLAMKHGMYTRMETLLKYRADPRIHTSENDHKRNLIHLAAVKEMTDTEFRNVVQKIKNRLKSDFQRCLDERDNSGKTALHILIDLKRYSRMKILLLEFSADPSVGDEHSRNCLHSAFMKAANGDVISELLKSMESLNLLSREVVCLEYMMDDYDCVPVQYLSRHTPLSAIKALKSEEVYLRIGRSGCQQLLRSAIEIERYDIIKVLLVKGVRVDITTLKDAVIDDNTFLAHILVRHAAGADLHRILNTPIPISETRRRGRGLEDQLDSDPKELGALDLLCCPCLHKEHSKRGTFGGKMRRWLSNSPFVVEDTDYEEDAGGRTMEIDGQEYSHTTWFRELITKMPSVAKEALERCVVDVVLTKRKESVEFQYHLFHSSVFKAADGSRVHSDVDKHGHEAELQPLVAVGNCDDRCHSESQRVYDKDGNPLELISPLLLMVKYERTDLLKHPIVRSYVYLKWRSLGSIFYGIGLMMHILFVGFLSLFAVTVNNPLSGICECMQQDEAGACGSQSHYITAYVCAACVILLTVYHLFKEIVWFYCNLRTYLFHVQNYLELVLYATAILFVSSVFANPCGCPERWQWQVGIASVFLAWLNLIFLAYHIPMISIYVIMFRDIFMTFTKLILFALLLVAAFSLLLFMMFHNPSSSAKISTYSNVSISFLSTLNMIAGGIGFETLFGINVPPSSYVPIPYHIFNFLMWILFLFFFPIIFKFMLISLAVDDVKKVREKAELKKVELQVKVFADAELILCWGIMKCYKKRTLDFQNHSHKFKLNVKQSKVEKWFATHLWGAKDFLDNVEDEVYIDHRNRERKELTQPTTDEHDTRLDELLDLVQSMRIALDNQRK